MQHLGYCCRQSMKVIRTIHEVTVCEDYTGFCGTSVYSLRQYLKEIPDHAKLKSIDSK